MFNGIVETTAIVLVIENDGDCKKLILSPHLPFSDLQLGESIAVNGVCLTVTHFDSRTFTVTVVPETLKLTNLDKIKIKDEVNIERSLQTNARISGHYVQGHVDNMGTLLELEKVTSTSPALLAKISLPPELAKYVVKKGYIALDGMSITVIDVGPNYFTVTFIPHTQAVTIINTYKIGQSINIEVDMMSKYIEKLMGATAHVHSH